MKGFFIILILFFSLALVLPTNSRREMADLVLLNGTVWTVAPLDLIGGIYAAVTRQTLDGKHPEGWFPEQKISLEEAIKCYTLNGAYAEFSENLKGSVKKGKLADLVVLSRNIFEIPPEEIQKTEVKMTIFNGKVIFKK